MPPIIFKNPPLVEVGISIQFLNNLQVADERHKFHALIKAEFPIVIMPETSKIRFDFSDYVLYGENTADRLEIGMNYFRYATTNYASYPKFRAMFFSALSMFRRSYAISSFNDLLIYYNNALPITSQQRFEDCFNLEVQVPEQFRERYFAGQGVLLFQEPEGVVAVELKPEFKENQITSYGFNLRFGANRQISFNEDNDEVSLLLEAGHSHIEEYFFSLLQPKFLEFLEAR